MDAVKLLTEDHRSFGELQKRYLAAQTPRLREDLARRILHEARLHITLEEKYVYPIAQERAGAQLDAHDHPKALLVELEQMELHDWRFKAQLCAFIEALVAHSNEEERVFFPVLKKAMRRSELDALGRLIENARAVRPDVPVANDLLGRAAAHVWANCRLHLNVAFERVFSTVLGASGAPSTAGRTASP